MFELNQVPAQESNSGDMIWRLEEHRQEVREKLEDALREAYFNDKYTGHQLETVIYQLSHTQSQYFRQVAKTLIVILEKVHAAPYELYDWPSSEQLPFEPAHYFAS